MPKLGCISRLAQHDLNKGLLDTYGRGNVHNSIHQYKPTKGGQFNNPVPFPADLYQIYKKIKASKGQTLTLGHKSDPFQWLDCKYKNTLKTLKLAKRYGVKLKINTISDLVAHDDYIELLKDVASEVVINIGFINEGLQGDEIERLASPGAPSIARRVKAMGKLALNGIKVIITKTDCTKLNETKQRELSIRLGWGIDAIRNPKKYFKKA
jgi:hypothetical protein